MTNGDLSVFHGHRSLFPLPCEDSPRRNLIMKRNFELGKSNGVYPNPISKGSNSTLMMEWNGR